MRVLAIDTSNQTMSVAVKDGAFIVGELTTYIKRNHSERLMGAIEELMKDTSIRPETLDRIAVAQGPGSYTGLRIGVTVAKTLAWSLGKELVGVSSLEVLAANREGSPNLLVPLFDARRNNVYTGLYKSGPTGIESVLADRHIQADQWAEELAKTEGKIELIGPDAIQYHETFARVLKDRLVSIPSKDVLPRAGVLASLAEKKQPVEPHLFLPVYLKMAEAEENWLQQNPGQGGGDYIEKY